MYARADTAASTLPVLFQCQDCQESFGATERAQHCPYCFSESRSNIVILYMEDDEERAEWLDLVDFSAGD